MANSMTAKRVVVWSDTTTDGGVFGKVVLNEQDMYEVQEGCCYTHSFTHPERFHDQSEAIEFIRLSLAEYDCPQHTQDDSTKEKRHGHNTSR